MAADVDERRLPGESPETYTSRLALAKAGAVASSRAGGLVIGADTIVLLDGEILGKPAGADQARAYLDLLRGRRHLVATAVAVLDAASGVSSTGIAWTGVWMRAFGNAERDAYIATGDPLDKAGAYAIQHGAFKPVARLEGAETNVIGLPLGLTRQCVARLVG